MSRPAPIAERFADKYEVVTETGCWLWTGSTDQNGYGRIGGYDKHGKYRALIATRVSLELAGVEIPDGLDACHKCDTPACVNPSHLFAGTAKQNAQDMVAKGRATQGGHCRDRTHCENGHELVGENLMQRSDRCGRKCRQCHNEYQREYKKGRPHWRVAKRAKKASINNPPQEGK